MPDRTDFVLETVFVPPSAGTHTHIKTPVSGTASTKRAGLVGVTISGTSSPDAQTRFALGVGFANRASDTRTTSQAPTHFVGPALRLVGAWTTPSLTDAAKTESTDALSRVFAGSVRLTWTHVHAKWCRLVIQVAYPAGSAIKVHHTMGVALILMAS